MEKKWVLKEPVGLEFKKKYPEIPGVILQLLANRGLTEQTEINQFLSPEYDQDLLDPFLFPDMEKAVQRIYLAVENNEKIAIHGDYDADGITASVLVANVLKQMKADFEVYIPHRDKEGYGLNQKTVKYFAKKKVKLIITVDCAISNTEEVELAKKNGIDVIITDHHDQPLELPQPLAVIDPKVDQCNYPFKFLAGVGVAFKLAQAIVKKDQQNIFPEGFEKWLLDLVAIGTVADMMPLLAENRILVKYGLIVLNKSKRLGLKLLAENAGLLPVSEKDLINSENLGYNLGPRINAAGRMDHANAASFLLLSEDLDEAKKLAGQIEINNQDRQKLTDKIIDKVRQEIKDPEGKYLILAHGKNWPLGIIGLASGRLKDEYNLPVVIISKTKGRIVGSGRSIPEFNLIEALQKLDKYFETYGGHPGAAGFSLKNKKDLPEIEKQLLEIAAKELTGKDLRPKLDIEAELDLNELNWELFDQIEKFEPFGAANPKPVFLVKNLKVETIKTVGQDNKHLKLFLKQDNMVKSFGAIGFGFGHKIEEIKYGNTLDVVCEINLNEFNGNRSLELKINDLKKV